MNIEEYARHIDLFNKNEIEKVKLLAFYMSERQGVDEFTPKDVEGWFQDLRLARPNLSRLRKKLVDSRQFVRAKREGAFSLQAGEMNGLRESHPEVMLRSEEIIATDVVLPESLYKGTRGYIERLAKQINASFDNNIFDGCAVLMRRLTEVLLILAYQHHGIDQTIQDGSGNYKMLERIVADARQNGTLKLSRNTKEDLDVFRTLGNFSAHKIYYNARRADLENHIIAFRALVEELLYKAGLRN